MPWRYRSCRKYFSVRTGSVMEGSKIGLSQFPLHLHLLAQPMSCRRIGPHQHVPVAVRTKVTPQHGAEHGKFYDLSILAIDGNRGLALLKVDVHTPKNRFASTLKPVACSSLKSLAG